MRNLSKQWCLESNPHTKETTMKIIIIALAIVMAVFNTPAKAEITGMMLTKQEVVNVITEANPLAGPKEIMACYDAMKHDGFYRIYSSRVTIVCTKNELTRMWAQ